MQILLVVLIDYKQTGIVHSIFGKQEVKNQ